MVGFHVTWLRLFPKIFRFLKQTLMIHLLSNFCRQVNSTRKKQQFHPERRISCCDKQGYEKLPNDGYLPKVVPDVSLRNLRFIN
jgi:hypothetical protein